MRLRKLALTCGPALLLLGCIILTILHSRTKMKVVLFFDGQTNDFSSGVVAVFRIANQGNVSVRRSSQYIVEAEHRSRLYPTARVLTGDRLLKAGQEEVVRIPAVTNQGAWRVTFRCIESGLKLLTSDLIGPMHGSLDQMGAMHLSDPVWKQSLAQWANPKSREIESEWIEAHDEVAQPTVAPSPATFRADLGPSDEGPHR